MGIKFNERCWDEPWIYDTHFQQVYNKIHERTYVCLKRLWVLWQVLEQTRYIGNEMWECGVCRGGTASLMCEKVREQGLVVRLFDTFEGIPYSDKRDNSHKQGDFKDSKFDTLVEFLSYDRAVIHKGIVPDTFVGMENAKIGFCHVDVDVYKSVEECCKFVWPRLVAGGVMVFDDYGFKTCAGARLAVDEFFQDKKEQPIITWGMSAMVYKSF